VIKPWCPLHLLLLPLFLLSVCSCLVRFFVLVPC
jgi:hypothetical protein